jgi:hypothetical protein
MFSDLLPIIGIGLATAILCYLVSVSPLQPPFKGWLWWGVLAIGVIWALSLVLSRYFGVSL